MGAKGVYLMIPKRQQRKEGAPSSAVRSLILRRAEELGISLSRISQELDKNPTYIQQFIWRDSPKILPAAVKVTLARVLRLAPEDLDADEHAPGASALMSERDRVGRGSGVLSLPADLPPREVTIPPRAVLPEFSDVDDILPPEGGVWADIPYTSCGRSASFKLWLTRPRSRLPAETLLVRVGGHTRIGDFVVVLREQRVMAVGELTSLTRDDATVAVDEAGAGTRPEAFPRSTIQLLKVSAAEFA